MIGNKEEAIKAVATVAATLDSLGVQGGVMCFRVGNAYMACLELKDYLQTVEDPTPEDDPMGDDSAEEELSETTDKGD